MEMTEPEWLTVELNIQGTSKQQQKAQGMQIMHGLTTMSVTLSIQMVLSLTKAIID